MNNVHVKPISSLQLSIQLIFRHFPNINMKFNVLNRITELHSMNIYRQVILVKLTETTSAWNFLYGRQFINHHLATKLCYHIWLTGVFVILKYFIPSLWLDDGIWRHWSWSTLVQVVTYSAQTGTWTNAYMLMIEHPDTLLQCIVNIVSSNIFILGNDFKIDICKMFPVIFRHKHFSFMLLRQKTLPEPSKKTSVYCMTVGD